MPISFTFPSNLCLSLPGTLNALLPSVTSGISPAIRAFLSQFVTSVEELETVLLLFRTAPRVWTVDNVSATLRTSTASAQAKLSRLQRQGLLSIDPRGYCLNKDTKNMGILSELEQLYKERRVSVISQIYESSEARQFSDAFKFRK